MPARKKRKVVEEEEDLPLSKRKKMLKADLKKQQKPRSLNSITKREERAEVEVEACYSGVCKFVKAQCPLCWNFWKVSQPYGQHVINQTCQKTDISAPLYPGEMTGGLKENTKFIHVHPATTKTDSYVSTSRVPSLKLLSRGSLAGGNSTSP